MLAAHSDVWPVSCAGWWRNEKGCKGVIYEVGIAYHGRTYQEGKKIGVQDGFRALWCILKYRFKPLRRIAPAGQ